MARARQRRRRSRPHHGSTVAGAFAAFFAGVAGYAVIEGVLLEVPHWGHLALTALVAALGFAAGQAAAAHARRSPVRRPA
jgi:predicted lysophospholipase L1 biosynthesis ABC-type transport system permease subunit